MKRRNSSFLTFRTDVGTWDAHFDSVLLHLHLVAWTRSDTGAVVHHEIIWQPHRIATLASPHVFYIRHAVDRTPLL